MPRRGGVIVSLHGGVGNQLFQYAAGRTLSARRGLPLHVVRERLPLGRSIGVDDLVDVPKPSLTRFERFLCGADAGFLVRAPASARRAARALARRTAGYGEVSQSLMEMADPLREVTPSTRYVHLRGLFQHRSWYGPVLDDVVAAIAQHLGPRLDPARGDGVVAMHFRRGDYLLHGYDLPLSFHEEALSLVLERGGPVSEVLVLSDDHDFALLAAEHVGRRGVVGRAVSGGSDLDDFCTLATAQHLVMSNSTFVWWAAVLGDRLRAGGAGRVVACPAPWMPLRAAATIPAQSLDLSRGDWVLHPVCR
jgi:hypothetical protein